jgi:nicotinamidase-related amidase
MLLTYHMRALSILASAFAIATLAGFAVTPAPSGDAHSELVLRASVQPYPAGGPRVEAYFNETIVNSRTAIIITDMWDKHWCSGATGRVGLLAARMEPVLESARRAGILIIHAPSETMDFYANAPGRLLAQNAPHVATPPELKLEDAPLPIDDSDGGCDTPGDKYYSAWKRENSALTIVPGDVISDDGAEIYNVLKEHQIDTVLYMGVHANMCILRRSFGVRQMSKWGMRCILVRDLTDAMYNPASRPFVSHSAGTELVIEFIEQYWAPSVTSSDLLAGLSGHRSSATLSH